MSTVLLLGNSETSVRRLGIYRIATALRRHGVTVHVVDFSSFFDPNKLLRIAKKLQPNWIGISTQWAQDNSGLKSFESEYGDVDANEPLLRQLSQIAPVVFGGQNPLYRIKTGPHAIVEYAITGFADEAVLALHDHIIVKKNISPMFEVINGIKVLHANTQFPVTDLSTLSTEFQDDDFIDPNEKICLETSRGCIFKCTFCNYQLKGKKPGTYIRNKEDIQADIERNHAQYGTSTFIFCDDTLNDCVEKLQVIKDVRDDSKIPFKFWAYGRIDLMMNNPEMEQLSKEIGWEVIFFGIESFNRESGRSVRKGADPEKIKEFLLRYAQEVPETEIHLGLIIGLPHDTNETLHESYKWLNDNPEAYTKTRPAIMRIVDPQMDIFPTEIDLQPEKYGYTITGELYKDRFLKWQTNELTFEEALAWQHKFKRLKAHKSWFRSPGFMDFINGYIEKKLKLYQKPLT